MKKIPLTKGKVALVDDADYPDVSRFKWHVNVQSHTCYAYTTKIDGRHTSMHRYLMGLKRGDKMVVDHADRNGLNNQRSNLTVVTASQNTLHMYRRDHTH